MSLPLWNLSGRSIVILGGLLAIIDSALAI